MGNERTGALPSGFLEALSAEFRTRGAHHRMMGRPRSPSRSASPTPNGRRRRAAGGAQTREADEPDALLGNEQRGGGESARPWLIGGAHPDWAGIEADLDSTLTAARDCCLEIICRDVSRIDGDRARLRRWAGMVRSRIGGQCSLGPDPPKTQPTEQALQGVFPSVMTARTSR